MQNSQKNTHIALIEARRARDLAHSETPDAVPGFYISRLGYRTSRLGLRTFHTLCEHCEARLYASDVRPALASDLDADDTITCDYCDHTYDASPQPIDTRPIMCRDCAIEHDLDGDPHVRALKYEPIGTACETCEGYISDSRLIPMSNYSHFMWIYTQPPTDTYHKGERTQRQLTAENVASFMRHHSVVAHTTLTGMVRALEGYTYRDDDGCIHYAEEWVLLDPQQTDIIYEFLGY